MQNIRLNKISLIPLLAGGLLLGLTAGSAWAESPASGSTSKPASLIEGWDADEEEGDLRDNWTWFGMGYESRLSGSQGSSAAGNRSSGASAAGVGGPAAVMNQRGPGRR